MRSSEPLRQRGKTINQADLRDTLIALARDGKMHTEMLWKIMDEVHALRATIRDLDSTFDEVLKRKRKERARSSTSAMRVVWERQNHLVRSTDK